MDSAIPMKGNGISLVYACKNIRRTDQKAHLSIRLTLDLLLRNQLLLGWSALL